MIKKSNEINTLRLRSATSARLRLRGSEVQSDKYSGPSVHTQRSAPAANPKHATHQCRQKASVWQISQMRYLAHKHFGFSRSRNVLAFGRKKPKTQNISPTSCVLTETEISKSELQIISQWNMKYVNIPSPSLSVSWFFSSVVSVIFPS